MILRSPASPTARFALTMLCTGLVNTACAVEFIDSIIAERGVTECSSSSSGVLDDTTTMTTSTSSSETSGPGDTTSHDISTSTGETTTGSSTDTGSSSTGPTPPICGNGIIEDGETCDDGNQTPGDGCQECAKDSFVFVTSELYQGFALGGLYGADQRCRNLAAKADLPRPLAFMAWLSTATMSAADRMVHSRGRYVLINGLVVAQNWDALTSGQLENPIAVDEFSQSRDDGVWTGTLHSGQPALGSEFCADWNDVSGAFQFAGAGLSMSTNDSWTYLEPDSCMSELRLYCIEQ
jgi:cysteine-rich repeat protein